ncbi:kinase-like protein [Sistotremastrum niveocremeum HHB9708]|uniref:Kinase-like protein n=1 Tax=Sistotremastrum niveocremeum HHB9708 TaxID=1314777 RepID=A0A164Z189_9AGAM|nr:kinase-like protein [Sistotremastrum niveocremeum HHB9708]
MPKFTLNIIQAFFDLPTPPQTVPDEISLIIVIGFAGATPETTVRLPPARLLPTSDGTRYEADYDRECGPPLEPADQVAIVMFWTIDGQDFYEEMVYFVAELVEEDVGDYVDLIFESETNGAIPPLMHGLGLHNAIRSDWSRIMLRVVMMPFEEADDLTAKINYNPNPPNDTLRRLGTFQLGEVQQQPVLVRIFSAEPVTDRHRRVAFKDKISTRTSTWLNIDHLNVLSYVGFAIDRQVRLCYGLTASERMPLSKFLGQARTIPLPLSRVQLVEGIAQGLKHLHDHNITHGSLRENTVLIDEFGIPKLCDYDLARALHRISDTAHGLQWTRWMAPELLYDLRRKMWKVERSGERNPLKRRVFAVSKAGDIWALGCIVFFIYYGKRPYYSMRNAQVRASLESGVLPRVDVPVRYHESIERLMDMCWSLKVYHRPDIDEVLAWVEDEPDSDEELSEE